MPAIIDEKLIEEILNFLEIKREEMMIIGMTRDTKGFILIELREKILKNDKIEQLREKIIREKGFSFQIKEGKEEVFIKKLANKVLEIIIRYENIDENYVELKSISFISK